MGMAMSVGNCRNSSTTAGASTSQIPEIARPTSGQETFSAATWIATAAPIECPISTMPGRPMPNWSHTSPTTSAMMRAAWRRMAAVGRSHRRRDNRAGLARRLGIPPHLPGRPVNNLVRQSSGSRNRRRAGTPATECPPALRRPRDLQVVLPGRNGPG